MERVTLTIPDETLADLDDASEILGVSRSALASALLAVMLRSFDGASARAFLRGQGDEEVGGALRNRGRTAELLGDAVAAGVSGGGGRG